MLVLSRRIGEEIVIAGDIRLTVVAVSGQRVRLGISAPRSVTVARQELLAQNSNKRQPDDCTSMAAPVQLHAPLQRELLSAQENVRSQTSSRYSETTPSSGMVPESKSGEDVPSNKEKRP